MLKEEALSMNKVLLLLLKLSLRTKSVCTLSISCLRVASSEVGGCGGDEADAEAPGAKTIMGESRRLCCPQNESEKTSS